MLLKVLVVGLLLSLGEVVNGNFRVRILHHLYGRKRAKFISFFLWYDDNCAYSMVNTTMVKP